MSSLTNLRLLLILLLSCNVSSSHVLMSASILSFSCWDSVTSIIVLYLFMNITLTSWWTNHIDSLLLFLILYCISCFLFSLNKSLALIEIVLCSHASLCIWTMWGILVDYWSFAVGCTSSGPPSVIVWAVDVELVEVVEHEVHIFLFFALEVMNDSLILVNFYSDVSISLSWDCSWLNKIAWLVIMIVSLCCWNFHVSSSIVQWSSVSSAHRLIIKFSALFL